MSAPDAAHPLLEVAPGEEGTRAGHLDRQGTVRRAEYEPPARSGEPVRSAKTVFVTAGRKARSISRAPSAKSRRFPAEGRAELSRDEGISKFCIEKFSRVPWTSVSVLYTRFVNTLTQCRSLNCCPIAR
jgi:hypothetical protein